MPFTISEAFTYPSNVCLLLMMVVLGLYYYHIRLTRSHLFKSVEKMYKGPTYLPFVGNALTFPLNDNGGILNKLMAFARQYERFYRLWLRSKVTIIIYDPKDVQVILTSLKLLTKSSCYKFTTPWIGYGLLTSTGAKWKLRRRIITPTFRLSIINGFLDVFHANGDILVDKLKKYVGQPTFDIHSYCNLMALDNICEAAMGTKINSQRDCNSTYSQAVTFMREIVFKRALQPWLTADILFNLSKYGAMQREALAILHRYTHDTILQRRNASKLTNKEKNENEKLAFLDWLLAAKEFALTDGDIQEEVSTIMFAGHDTVGSTISFTLYALSQNLEVQDKVYEEQKIVLGDSKMVPTIQDYCEMTYLERVIKETLRMYPSVPIINRLISEDQPLSDGYVLPKDSQVSILIAALHMNPKLWPDPHKFDPDRFLQENIATRHPYAYIPFSSGPRSCIGKRFAMLELKSCVSKVVRNYRLLPCAKVDEVHMKSELTLTSSNGINLSLNPRV